MSRHRRAKPGRRPGFDRSSTWLSGLRDRGRDLPAFLATLRARLLAVLGPLRSRFLAWPPVRRIAERLAPLLAALLAWPPLRRALAESVRLVRRMRWEYPRPGRQGFRRWVPSWRQVVSLVLGVIGLLTGVVGFAYSQTKIPKDLNSFATQQDNVYYWADGTEMGRTGQINRQAMSLDKVPEPVQWAVLAAENETFYSDYGISPSGIGRALYRMGSGGETQGGSTITQQYVKNAYLSQSQTLSRKINEMFIAIKLDNKMSKKQILEGYLNTSWFGRGTYGIQRASQAYYGKPVSQLNVSEGAFLACLLRGAGLYDPAIGQANRARAVERWSWILDRMVKIGKLSAVERAKYTTFPEPIETPRAPGLSGQAGYLVDTARAYVAAHTDISDEEFDRGGYQIHTTFEKPKEAALAKSVQKVNADLQPARRPADQHVRVGAASVAADGRILALYGGPDYLKQGFNDANASAVPAGTAFTPFVYAAALRDGIQLVRGEPRTPVTPQTAYNGNDKVPVRTPEGPYWDRSGKIVKGTNDDSRNWGTITLREAMVQSVNTPLMQLGMDAGLDVVGKAAVDAGLLPDTLGPKVPAFSLGNSTPSAIRMAAAYQTFAADGVHVEPYSVLKVTKGGDVVTLERPAARRVFSAQVAEDVTDALESAVQRGTAKAARGAKAGRGADGSGLPAGKTGTEQSNKSAWFVGYTKQLSTAVSLFRIDPKSQEPLPLTGLGGAAAGRIGSDRPIDIWTDYMNRLGRTP